MVIVRLADVSSADIVSLVMKPKAEAAQEAEAPKAEEKKEDAKKKA